MPSLDPEEVGETVRVAQNIGTWGQMVEPHSAPSREASEGERLPY